MKVNIITSSVECIEFLSYFQLIGKNTLNVKFEVPIANSALPSDTENNYKWTSWLRLGSYSHIKRYNSSDYDSDEKYLKTNTFKLSAFLAKHKKLTYEEFKGLFFYKTEQGKYVTTNRNDFNTTLQNLKITEDSWWLSVGVYYSDNIAEQYLIEDCFQNSYEQLKIFYSSFIEKYHRSLLILLPHFNHDAYWEREELEGRVYPASSYDDHDDSGSWAELGREEERRMDEETDGFWRLNID